MFVTLFADKTKRYHSNRVGNADDAEEIRSIRLGVTVSGKMLGKIKVRHDKPSEQQDR